MWKVLSYGSLVNMDKHYVQITSDERLSNLYKDVTGEEMAEARRMADEAWKDLMQRHKSRINFWVIHLRVCYGLKCFAGIYVYLDDGSMNQGGA